MCPSWIGEAQAESLNSAEPGESGESLDSAESKAVVQVQGNSTAVLTLPVGYRPYGFGNLVVTSTFGASALIAPLLGPRKNGPQGGVLFDEAVRNVLRAPTFSGRLAAADVSDVLLGLSVTNALLGDPLVNATWARKSPKVGQQIFLMNLEVLAVTMGIQQLTANSVGRERPYGRTCGSSDLPADTRLCTRNDRYRSFFSGHTAIPFSMAAATCTHHLKLGLSGKFSWATCLGSFLVAGTSGALRIVGDFHYATDVATGALVGSALGFGLPLLHYGFGVQIPSARIGQTEVFILPTPMGILLTGSLP